MSSRTLLPENLSVLKKVPWAKINFVLTNFLMQLVCTSCVLRCFDQIEYVVMNNILTGFIQYNCVR